MPSDVRPKSLARIETRAQAKKYAEAQIKAIKEQVGDGKVLLALSGGVDSSVCAVLISKAVGENLTCVHVNNGLLRKGEPEEVCRVFSKQFKNNFVYVDAADRFLDKLAGVKDPEKKRKIIGKEFSPKKQRSLKA
jgi:GMP synthase (glutamine-hydrolysing)